MNVEQLIASMTPEIYQNMRKAVELSKWGDGRPVTQEQRETCIEAMIRYEHLNEIPETERIGYVDTTNHRKKKIEKEMAQREEPQPIKFVDKE